jgi:hypothetical protein
LNVVRKPNGPVDRPARPVRTECLDGDDVADGQRQVREVSIESENLVDRPPDLDTHAERWIGD